MNERLDPPQAQGNAGWSGASWSQNRDQAADATPGATMERFLGGSPGSVAMRLLLVSLVVGALMMWLDIRPWDIFWGIEIFLHRIWHLGFGAVREVGQYILAGAIIVIPIWFVMRLLNAGRNIGPKR